MTTTPKQVLAWLERDLSYEEEKQAKERTQRGRMAHEAAARAYRGAIRYVEELIPPIILNKEPTPEDFKAVAAKFYEAGNGDGPGVTAEVLAQIGVPAKPRPTPPRQASWEGMCRYVWSKFTKDKWPSSPARGRGRFSRDVARNVAQLLEKLAAEKAEAA